MCTARCWFGSIDVERLMPLSRRNLEASSELHNLVGLGLGLGLGLELELELGLGLRLGLPRTCLVPSKQKESNLIVREH